MMKISAPSVAASGWAIVSFSTLGWCLLSFEFVFGEGHAERPLLSFLLLYFLAWIGYLLLVKAVIEGLTLPTGLLLALALVPRMVLLPSELIQENDVYRYVLDGQTVLSGGNPYQYAPIDLDRIEDHSLADQLDQASTSLVLDRIGYPHLSTVYPPVAQLGFAAGALLGGWSWQGQRWVMGAADLLLLLLLLALLKLTGRRRELLLLYGLCPLVLKEIWNSAHVDVLAGVLIALALLAWHRPRSRIVSGVLTGLLLGGAVMTKIYPIVVVPPFFLAHWQRGRWQGVLPFLAAGAGTCLGTLMFFGELGLVPLTRGLRAYALWWVNNPGFFSLLGIITSQPRVWAGILLLLAVAARLWVYRERFVQSLEGNLQWILLLCFLFLPAAFPWYALPLIVLLPLQPETAAGRTSLLLAGLGGLYYFQFYVEYHQLPTLWWTLVRGVEHALLWLALLCFAKSTRPEGASWWADRPFLRK